MAGRVRCSVMTDSELNLMKNRMERLLIERGVHMDHEELLKALAEAGCIVDMENRDVKFTKEQIDKAVAAVPAEFTLYSPSGKRDMKFPHPEGKFYTRTNTGAPLFRTVDGDTHYYTLEESDEWFRLCNAMDNLDYVCMPSVSEHYVPGEAVDVYTLNSALKNSAKHIWVQPYGKESVRYLIDMSAAAAGGAQQLREKPIVSFISCSVPCLKFKEMDGEILYLCAKNGVPVQPCALPTAGANSPVTAQGTALAACADVMAQIVMLELLCPGLPVIATPLLFSMDMQTTYTLQSNTEITIGRLICMELFERGYNIRAHSYGTGTDSLTLDAQNFIERTSLTDAMAMSWASVLGGLGQLETAKTNNPQQLIIDNEIFGIAQRIRMGLPVTDEAMDFGELLSGADKGPSFSYVTSAHTARHCREMHRPDMFNRCGVPTWESMGKKTLLDQAEEKYRAIMETPDSYELPADRAAELEKVVKAAHKTLVKE